MEKQVPMSAGGIVWADRAKLKHLLIYEFLGTAVVT